MNGQGRGVYSTGSTLRKFPRFTKGPEDGVRPPGAGSAGFCPAAGVFGSGEGRKWVVARSGHRMDQLSLSVICVGVGSESNVTPSTSCNFLNLNKTSISSLNK